MRRPSNRAIFSGKGSGFAEHNFAGKLLGRTSKGKLLFGHCRLPWVNYGEPIVTVRQPQLIGDRRLRIEVANHGQAASKDSSIKILVQKGAEDRVQLTAACPAIPPYERRMLEVELPAPLKPGQPYEMEIVTGLDLQQPTVFSAVLRTR